METRTPLKSIRKYCLWCCYDQLSEVKKCPSDDCFLYPYRLGKRTIRRGSVIKRIKKRCRDCGEGKPSVVKKCEFPDCPLYPFRTGKGPSRTHKEAQNQIINKKEQTCDQSKDDSTI